MTKREKELIDQGWEKRFIASEPRLSEAIELYESMGFDVFLEPLSCEEELKRDSCENAGCTACYGVADKERYRIIFTKASASSQG